MVGNKISEKYSDSQVVQKILLGETALYEILIRRYNPYLYKTGRSYGFGHEDTQDLMQESFVNAYFHLQDFEHRSTFKTWLIKIMLHQCFRKVQKFSFKLEHATEIPEVSKPMFSDSNTQDPMNELSKKEINRAIENALLHIPVEYRMVFSLREVSGLNVAETSEALEISEANVKVRLNRAKMMLRKELERNYSMEDILEFHLMYCDAMVNRVMAAIHSVK
ncbi:MAG: sigma-70 family RNA polymerase sigma factor [Bacteroidetes bacterium]|nr:sigma-70 family RNA polymerase sigma factor [Bacteroidota bacterium]